MSYDTTYLSEEKAQIKLLSWAGHDQVLGNLNIKKALKLYLTGNKFTNIYGINVLFIVFYSGAGMLKLLECFIIKYTIPELDSRLFDKRLPKKDSKRLKLATGYNQQLILGFPIGDDNFRVIRNYFLTSLCKFLESEEALEVLPYAIKKQKLPPSLKLLAFRSKEKSGFSQQEKKNTPQEILDLSSLMNEKAVAFGGWTPRFAKEKIKKIFRLWENESNNQNLNIDHIMSALEIALICGAKSLIDTYLNQLGNINQDIPKLIKVLKWTIEYSHNKIFIQLLPGDFSNQQLYDLLISALKNSNIDLVDLLWPKVNIPKIENHHPSLLHFLAKIGDLEKIKYVQSLSLSLPLRNEDNLLPIHYAITRKNTKNFEYLLQLVHQQLTEEDHYQLFFQVCSRGQIELVEYLIEKKFNINATRNGKNILQGLLSFLTQKIDEELDSWEQNYMNHHHLTSSIDHLLNTEPQLAPKKYDRTISLNLLHLVDVRSKTNKDFSDTVIKIIDHNLITDNLSIFQRYGKNSYNEKMISHFIKVVSIVNFLFFVASLITKITTTSSKQHAATDITLALSTLIFVANVATLCTLARPRNRLPCTNFFRRNFSNNRDENHQPVNIINP